MSWQSEMDGGHPQTFCVLCRMMVNDSFSACSPNMSDPGLGTIVNYTVTGLLPETQYVFVVQATNISGSVFTDAVNATTEVLHEKGEDKNCIGKDGSVNLK